MKIPTIMMAASPQECAQVFNGLQTIMPRKTAPKPPFRVVLYETRIIDSFIRQCKTIEDKLYESRYLSNTAYRIYHSQGKAIGEFIVCEVDGATVTDCGVETDGVCRSCFMDLPSATCLSLSELTKYASKRKHFKLLHIVAPKLYDMPKELGEFFTEGECPGEKCEYCKNFHMGRGWLDGSCYDEDECIVKGLKPVTHVSRSYIRLADMEEL